MTELIHWGGEGLSSGAMTVNSVGAGDFPTLTGVSADVTIDDSVLRSPRIKFGAINSVVDWNFPSPVTQSSGRFYLTMPDAWPSASRFLAHVGPVSATGIRLTLGGGGSPGSMRLETSLTGTKNELARTANNVFSLGFTVRIEWQMDHVSETATLRMYNYDDIVMLAELTGSIAGIATDHSLVTIGALTTGGDTGIMYLDDVKVTDTLEWLGPAVSSSPGGQVYVWDGTELRPASIKIWDGSALRSISSVEQSTATNMLVNSSFEYDFGGLTESSGANWEGNPAAARSRVNDGTAFHGDYYCVLSNPDDRPSPNLQSEDNAYSVCSPGEIVTATTYFRFGAGTAVWQTRLDIQFFDASDEPIEARVGVPTSPPTSWERLMTVSNPAPAGTHHAQTRIVMTNSELGDQMHLDALKMELGSNATSYIPNPNDGL